MKEKLEARKQQLNGVVVALELERARARDRVDLLDKMLENAVDQFEEKERDFRANSGALTQVEMLIEEINQQEAEARSSAEAEAEALRIAAEKTREAASSTEKGLIQMATGEPPTQEEVEALKEVIVDPKETD